MAILPSFEWNSLDPEHAWALEDPAASLCSSLTLPDVSPEHPLLSQPPPWEAPYHRALALSSLPGLQHTSLAANGRSLPEIPWSMLSRAVREEAVGHATTGSSEITALSAQSISVSSTGCMEEAMEGTEEEHGWPLFPFQVDAADDDDGEFAASLLCQPEDYGLDSMHGGVVPLLESSHHSLPMAEPHQSLGGSTSSIPTHRRSDFKRLKVEPISLQHDDDTQQQQEDSRVPLVPFQTPGGSTACSWQELDRSMSMENSSVASGEDREPGQSASPSSASVWGLPYSSPPHDRLSKRRPRTDEAQIYATNTEASRMPGAAPHASPTSMLRPSPRPTSLPQPSPAPPHSTLSPQSCTLSTTGGGSPTTPSMANATRRGQARAKPTRTVLEFAGPPSFSRRESVSPQAVQPEESLPRVTKGLGIGPLAPVNVVKAKELDHILTLTDLNQMMNGPRRIMGRTFSANELPNLKSSVPTLRRVSSMKAVLEPWSPRLVRAKSLESITPPVLQNVHVTRLRTPGNGSITIKRSRS